MVGLAQDFTTRYPLVDGHGNFGSRDGDSAAAMRYTEARLTPVAMEMLKDINKNTIDLKDNYDGEEKEPIHLGGYFPCLLANGSSGIAVGMSAKIPSHNLHDIYNCCYFIIDKIRNDEEYTIDDLINIIQAPDFATGGTIVGLDGVKEGYKTGRGSFKIRGKYNFENEYTLVITEIPYKVNKQKLVERIMDLMKDVRDPKTNKKIKSGTLNGIKEIRDESDRDGMRIVIEFKKDANPNIVLNNILIHTDLQINYGMILRTLIDGRPVLTNLQQMLEKFLENSTSVLLRSTEYDLNKYTNRLELVEGILRLYDETDPEDENKLLLDTVIDIIRNSDDPDIDIINLGFTEKQNDYIQDMKLRKLRKLSVEEYRNERTQLIANIDFCNSIINDNNVLLSELEEKFKEVENKCGDDRRTDIMAGDGIISSEDLIKDETLIITYTSDGSIKAVEEKEYKSQKRGGKGVKGTKTKEDEIIKFMFTTNSKDDLLFFTNLGKCHTLKAYKIDKSSKTAKGKNIINYINLSIGEKIVGVINANLEDKDNHLLLATTEGIVKKISLNELSKRMSVTTVIDFKNDTDMLIQAILIKDENVLLATKEGQTIRIDTTLIKAQGRKATGVKGITLKDNDEVIDMTIISNDKLLLTVTEKGLGKMTKCDQWSVINRGGKGVKGHNINEKTGNLISVLTVNEDDQLFIATNNGQITKIPLSDVRICSRTSTGVKCISLSEGDIVSSVSLSLTKNEETDNEEEQKNKE